MSGQVKQLFTVNIRMHISVSGNVSVYADVYNLDGTLIVSKLLPKRTAQGDYILDKKAVVDYSADLAVENVLAKDPDSLFMGRRNPVDLSVFELEGVQ